MISVDTFPPRRDFPVEPMNESRAELPLESLLAYREWVRSLARRLVADEARADDVVQEVYAGAARRPPSTTRSIRGWLAVVTRNAARKLGRGERRRARHEDRAPATAPADAAADVAARADLHRCVVAAVVDLPEPVRAAILLRYFEGLSLREVAERTGSPFETTRKRIARGHEMLRRRLAPDPGGDDRPLAVLLLPLLAKPRTGAIPTLTGGALMTITKTKVAVALAALALFAAALTLGPPGDSAPAPDDPGAVPGVPAPPPPASEPAGPGVDVGMLLDAPVGPLDLKDDRMDAALGELAARTGIPIFLTRSAVREIEEQKIGASLRLRQALPARKVLDLLAQVRWMEWELEGQRVVFRLRAGRRDPDEPLVAAPGYEPDPDAPRRLVVRGRVFDAEGDPVAGAQLFGVDERSTRDLGSASRRGSFELTLAKPYPRLVARSPGCVDSLAVPVRGEPGETVRVDLALRGPAARVEGTVRDEAGEPVAGAFVRAGGAANPRWDAAGPIEPPSLAVRTGDDGRFVCASVPPGDLRLRAGLRGWRPAFRELFVAADATTRVDLVLPTGLVVSGTVRDESGGGVAGATVRVMRPGGEIFDFGETDADGAYRISGIPEMGGLDLAVVAQDGGGVRASERLDPADGPDLRCDLVLTRGRTVKGTVVDDEGRPLPGYGVATVVARLRGPRESVTDRVRRWTHTDERGRFALAGVDPGPVRIAVRPPTRLIPEAVVAVEGPETIVRIEAGSRPSARLRLRLLDAAGDPVGNAWVRIFEHETRAAAGGHADAGGNFESRLLPPGRYDVVVRTNEEGYLRFSRTLRRGEIADLGDVRYPEPARLRVIRPAGPGKTYRVFRVDEIFPDGSRERVGSAVQMPGAENAVVLAPGRYAVRFQGPGAMGEERRIELAPGGEAEITVALAPAPVRQLRVSLPEEMAPRAVLLTILDSGGVIVRRALSQRKPVPGPFETIEAPLLPGDYEVRALAAEGRVLRAHLTIPGDAAEGATFPLDLR